MRHAVSRIRVLAFRTRHPAIKSVGCMPVCVTLASPVAMFREEVRSAETCFATLAVLAKANLLRSHEVARVQPVIESLSG